MRQLTSCLEYFPLMPEAPVRDLRRLLASRKAKKVAEDRKATAPPSSVTSSDVNSDPDLGVDHPLNIHGKRDTGREKGRTPAQNKRLKTEHLVPPPPRRRMKPSKVSQKRGESISTSMSVEVDLPPEGGSGQIGTPWFWRRILSGALLQKQSPSDDMVVDEESKGCLSLKDLSHC